MSNLSVFQPVNTWPDELRPRERLLRDGPGALSDAELLAVLLRTGTHRRTVLDVARDAIMRAGGLRQLAQWHPQEWTRAPGIGMTKAATVMAALEFGRRTWTQRAKSTALASPADVYDYIAPRFLGETRETLWIVGFDAKNVPVVEAIVGQGTADRAPAHAREVFAPLLRAGALKGVLCHNHPSGDPEPSPQDIQLTRKLKEAGRALDLPIVDHLVIGDGRYVSLHERGLL